MDCRIKMPLYSRYATREAWLLDLTRNRLEVHRHPTAEGYRDVRVVERGQPVTAEAFPQPGARRRRDFRASGRGAEASFASHALLTLPLTTHNRGETVSQH